MMSGPYEFGSLIGSLAVWISIGYCVWFFVRRKTVISVIIGLLFGIFLLNMPGFFALLFCLIFYCHNYYKEKTVKRYLNQTL